MSPRKRIALLAGIAMLCVVGALLAGLMGGGSATMTQDTAATKSYLAARRALETNIERLRTQPISAVKAYVAGIGSTCAGALRGAPPIRGKRRFYVRNGSTLVLAPREILFSDATVGVEQTMQLADVAAISRFIHEARGLRWTDTVATKLVHALVDLEGVQLEQEAPELCRDAHAWAASRYKLIPAHTSRTAERLGVAREVLMQALVKEGCDGPYPGRAVLRVLEHTMSPGERRTAEELSRLEGRLDARNAEAVQTAVVQIENVLGSRFLSRNGQVHRVDVVPPCVAVPRPKARDVVASSEFMRARFRMEEGLKARLPAVEGGIGNFAAHINSACGGTLRHAPRQGAGHADGSGALAPRDQLVAEAETGLQRAMLRAQRGPRSRFIKTVEHLTWSSEKVTRLVHALLAREAAWLGEAMPDVCIDVHSWVVSGYRVIPQGAMLGRLGVHPISSQAVEELVGLGYGRRFPERSIARLLTRYGGGAVRRAFDRTQEIEAEVRLADRRILGAGAKRLDRALGVPAIASR